MRLYLKKGQFNKAANEALDELAPAHFHEVMQATFGLAQPHNANLALPAALWLLLLILDGIDELPPSQGVVRRPGRRAKRCWPVSPTHRIGRIAATGCWPPADRTD